MKRKVEKISIDPMELKFNKVWMCRFHPTDWFHEIGCPHVQWCNCKKTTNSGLHISHN